MNGLRRNQRGLPRGAKRGAILSALLLAAVGVAGPLFAQAPAPPAAPRPGWDVSQADSCRRCYVQARFLQKLQSLPVESEPVEMKNGVGLFYTTTKPKFTATLQKLVESTLDDLHEINEHRGESRLCVICQRDFPVFSKFEHEVVDLNQGVLVLITSRDPKAVKALRQMYARQRSYIDMDKLREQMEELRQESEKLRVNGGR